MLTDSLFQIPDNNFYMAPGPFEKALYLQDSLILNNNIIFVNKIDSSQKWSSQNIVAFNVNKKDLPKSFNIFAEHQLPAINFVYYQKKATYSDWITLVLVGSLLLITFMKVMYAKRFFDFFKTFFSYRYFNFLIRESNLFKEQISILLIINYFLIVSLFIFLCLRYFFNLPFLYPHSILLYGEILMYLLIIVLIKNFFKVIVGQIYQTQSETYQYLHNTLVSEVMAGIFLFPVCIFMVFQPSIYIFYFGFAIIVVLSIYKLIRLMIIGKVHGKFSVFYLFLYLCTIEILPMFIIVKLIMNYLQIG